MGAWFEVSGRTAGLSQGIRPLVAKDTTGPHRSLPARLLITTAVALALPVSAQAVDVSNRVEEPIDTATIDGGAAGDITIRSGGSVEVTNGPAVTLNSNNLIVNNGSIEANAAANAVGVQIQGGFTGGFTNSNDVVVVSAEDDEDPIGDAKTGIDVTGPGAFTGDIVLEEGSTLLVEGTNSLGIVVRTDLIGNVTNEGRVDVNGADSTAILIDAPVTGDVTTSGIVEATGENTAGIVVRNAISGALRNEGSINNFSTENNFFDDLDLAEDEDIVYPLSQGAVLVGGSLGAGFLNDGTNTELEGAETVFSARIDANFAETAILISPTVSDGEAGDITLGAVGTAENFEDFAFINRGSIASDSADEGDPTTGVRIEGASIGGTDYTTTLERGLKNTNLIRAGTIEADATTVSVGAGATVPEVVNMGTLRATITGDAGGTARGIEVGEGATVTSVVNEGLIDITSQGETAAAIGIEDRSGTLTTIVNRGGTISTSVSDGIELDAPEDPILRAIDLSTSGADVTVTNQGSIFGDINLGAGDDTVSLEEFFLDPDEEIDEDEEAPRSSVFGSIFTGLGADQITLTGGALLSGGIYNEGGTTDLTVTDGEIFLPAGETITVTNALLGADSITTVFINAETTGTTRITATDTVTIEDGAQFDVQLEEFLGESAEVTLIDASTLIVNGELDIASDDLFFLYNGELVTPDSAPNTVLLQLDLKTAGELGLNNNQTAAYPAVVEALTLDDGLAVALGNIGTDADFFAAYNQLLPDTGRAARTVAVALTDQTTQMIGSRLNGLRRIYRPERTTAWFQVFGSVYEQDATEEEFGFDGETFGIAAGVDRPWLGSNALGVNFAWAGSRIEEKDSFDDEFMVDTISLGAYGSWSLGPLFLDLHGQAGYNKYRQQRRVEIDTFERRPEGDWDGHQYSGSARLGADFLIGKTRITPMAGVDYLQLEQNDYAEDGGGDGIDLFVGEQEATSTRVSGTLEVAHTFQVGEGLLTPAVRGGYRQELETDPLTTTARFRDGTEVFQITGDAFEDSGYVGGFSVIYELDALRLEAGYDALVEDTFFRHSGGLAFRFIF